MQDSLATYRRPIVGVVVTLASLGVLLALLLPFRSHLSIATPALVFVLPALIGVVIAGSIPGAVGAVAGFLAYDFFFLPPYQTLTVRSPQNWIALFVYVAVVLIVAQVVANLRAAREEALRRTEEARRLYDLSRTLIGDLTLNQLVTHVVSTVQEAFSPRWTALVLPDGQAGPQDGHERLHVAASAGEALTSDELTSLVSGGQTRSLGFVDAETPTRVSVALVLDNRPVGMLVLQDAQLAGERSLLGTFANQAALAVDRARLRDQALRTRLLEEIDRWRSALMGAASHDLRTPLASVKTAVSSLRSTDVQLGPQDRAELLELIEKQTDRLSRLVSNLLDMTRIESGALELRPIAISFDELVAEALGMLGDIADRGRIRIDIPDGLALLHIDHVLISQVVANLVDNAERLSPQDGIIRISARPAPGAASRRVEISVSDQGPGIAPDDRERVFEMFSQNGGGGRAGLGLAIAKAFVEAHGGLIWIDPNVERGARVVFTVPSEARVPAAV
jgi:two-component system, OmpR family, sensor histidine kinase KdpD